MSRRRSDALFRYGWPVLLLVAALSFTACAGDDGPDEVVLDEARASTIAQASMLEEADLPPAPWEAQDAEVDFAPQGMEFADDLFAGPECEALARLIEGRQAEAAAEPLAGAGRLFDSEEGLLTMRFVSSSVTVFETVPLAEEAHALMADAVNADALRPCFEEGLGDLAREQGVEVRRLELGDAAARVDDSRGVTVELELFAIFFTIDLNLHIHSFQRDHAVATLVALELNSDLVTEAQQSILDAFEGRVVAALEGS